MHDIDTSYICTLNFMQQHPKSKIVSEANLLLKQAGLRETIKFLKNALSKQGNCYESWLLLSKCLYHNGQYKEAAQVVFHAEQYDPLQDDFRLVQGAMQKNAINEAAQTAQQMLAKIPAHPRGIFTLAHIAMQQQDPFTSIKVLQHGIEQSPANLTLLQQLVASQELAGDYSGAIKTARTISHIDDSFNALWSLINLLLKLGQHNELLDLCKLALDKVGNDKVKLSQVQLVQAQTYRIIGQRNSSIEGFRASLSANPNNAEAWWALADMKNFMFTEQDKANMKLLSQSQQAPQISRCVASFALAKASESELDWAKTMKLYEAANKLHHNRKFDPKQLEQEFSARVSGFNKAALNVQAKASNKAPRPIFIVGLPRSGSTLVEQILASHSQVEGTIEQPTLQSIERQAQAFCYRNFKKSLLGAIGALSADDLYNFGQSYLSNGKLFRHENLPFFTDKQPFNFRHIGLIHKILPNALIIDVRRHPLDCGFSLYKQYFPSGVDFSNDLNHIGIFYNAYTKLMDHWDAVLPGKVYHLQYEALVKDPETQIRMLLAHIGLNFEIECVDFQKNKRKVHTASSEQVRQAINTNAVGAWQKVDNDLTPLKDSLGAQTLMHYQQYIHT